MDFTAASLYGGQPSIQPTSTGQPDHPPGTPEPTMRTEPRPGGLSLAGNPTLLLVALVGAAAVMVMRLHGHFG